MAIRLQAALLTVTATVLAVTATAFTAATLAADVDPAHDSPVSDQAEIHEINREFKQAIGEYKRRIETIEQESGLYAEELIDPLMGLARNYEATGDHISSIDSSERVVHVAHRNDGVYALRQLEALDLLIEININMEEPLKADTVQKFALFIVEHNFDKDSPELLPTLDKMSNWYIETGQLNRATASLNRSAIIRNENKVTGDPLQLSTLISRAKVKRLQRRKSYRVLEGALPILAINPGIPEEQRSQVFVELADAYSLAGKSEESLRFYRLAWKTMSENQRTENFFRPRQIALSKRLNQEDIHTRMFKPSTSRFGRPGFEELTLDDRLLEESLPPQEFFLPLLSNDYKFRLKERSSSFEDKMVTRVVGHPIQFVHEQLLNILPGHLRSDDDLAQLSVELNFTVRANGRLTNIAIVSSNTPGRLGGLMRKVLRKVVYRPQMVDGQPVETSNVTIYQTFEP